MLDKKNFFKKDAAILTREVECKLDAPDEASVKQVADYIENDNHYVPANSSAQKPQSENNVELERVYFDTLNLSGYKAGIEIRVEHKIRGLKDDKPYKMVVKIDAEDKKKGSALDRLEETYRMEDSEPDLSVIKDKPVRDALKWAFGVKKVDDVDLYPLVRIMAQRSKFTYHPGGDKSTKVEFDKAVGKGHDFTGYAFDVLQCELESKSGATSAVETEGKRLRDKFDFLATSKESKPTPGFRHLKTILKNKKARKFAQRNLKHDSFRVLNNIPF
jgi:hypothetical protein